MLAWAPRRRHTLGSPPTPERRDSCSRDVLPSRALAHMAPLPSAPLSPPPALSLSLVDSAARAMRAPASKRARRVAESAAVA